MAQCKRSHGEIEQSDTLDAVPEDESRDKNAMKTVIHLSDTDRQDGWQIAESRSSKRRKKLPRKESDKYPSITHSPHARLQSVVRLGDLQTLVLYLLADGAGPQWCSIQHHANVRKVVALMVPGLELGMFDGSVALPSGVSTTESAATSSATNHPTHHRSTDLGTDNAAEAIVSTNGHVEGPRSSIAQQPVTQETQSKKAYSSPDEFYPKKLKKEHLSPAIKPLAEIFEHVWPIKTPGDDRFARMHSPLASMLTTVVPQKKEVKSDHAKGTRPPGEAQRWHNERTPVTEYIASTHVLLTEGYVLHPAHFADDASAAEDYQKTRARNGTTTTDGWIDTPNIQALSDGEVPDAQIEQGASTAGRTVLAIDCEMCITSSKDVQPAVYSLTRMSVIDWDGTVVLDQMVMPHDPITDYLTAYSGITPKMMEGVSTTLQEAQQMLLTKITPQTILVGHSLVSDLNALRITHPFIVDTALLYPHPRGPPLKSSLKWLTQKYLNRQIQTGHGSTGHNSIEDARAALDLVKQKCERGKQWGTSEASNESIFLRLARSQRPKRYKIHPDGEAEPRTGAVVDWGDPRRGFGGRAAVSIGCEDDLSVVNGVKAAVAGDRTNASIPVDGVDFVWARFRELEAHRQWWDSSKSADGVALRESAIAAHANTLLGDVVAKTVARINEIWQSLPPCTAFVVYTGSGDPRKLREMQDMQRKHKAEYAIKKWDELSIRWTDVEEQDLRKACVNARRGIGFIAVK